MGKRLRSKKQVRETLDLARGAKVTIDLRSAPTDLVRVVCDSAERERRYHASNQFGR